MHLVNPFDARIVSWLNHWAQRSWALDAAIGLSSSYLFRVAGIVPVIWWAWFREDSNSKGNPVAKARDCEFLAFGMLSCLFSLFVSRMVSRIATFRIRPLRNPELHFQLPYGQTGSVLLHWSSFPSDHAAVYFTLAMCTYFVSKKAGLFVLGYTFFVTCMTRIYMGLHYPTDILAGAALGMAVASLSLNPALRAALTKPVLRWQEVNPGLFYAGFFLYSLQLATAFEAIREIGDFIIPLTQHAARALLAT
jgi:undecaprenyl-diphosphatase